MRRDVPLASYRHSTRLDKYCIETTLYEESILRKNAFMLKSDSLDRKDRSKLHVLKYKRLIQYRFLPWLLLAWVEQTMISNSKTGRLVVIDSFHITCCILGSLRFDNFHSLSPVSYSQYCIHFHCSLGRWAADLFHNKLTTLCWEKQLPI
jgi:hypothetical protein